VLQTGYCKDGFCNTINVQCRFVWDKGMLQLGATNGYNPYADFFSACSTYTRVLLCIKNNVVIYTHTLVHYTSVNHANNMFNIFNRNYYFPSLCVSKREKFRHSRS